MIMTSKTTSIFDAISGLLVNICLILLIFLWANNINIFDWALTFGINSFRILVMGILIVSLPTCEFTSVTNSVVHTLINAIFIKNYIK